MVDRRLYNNLPLYARFADEKGLLQIICDLGIQPLLDSIERKLSQREAFFDPTHPLSRDHILFLGQFVGLMGNRDRWIGIGLNPDWDWETQLDVLLRAPAYWKIVGTERGIREAISMWLRYNGGIKFYQPFGYTPRIQPRWADYLTPYDHYACRNFEDAKILGMPDFSPGTPPWSRFVSESWEWDYAEPFGTELKDATPKTIPSTDAAMGPRNAWKFFDLDKKTWPQIFPLINTLDIESVPALTKPTNIGWLSYTLPFEITAETLEGQTHLIGETCYDSDGFQYGNLYGNSPIFIRAEEVVRETCEKFPGNYFFCYQYTDLLTDFGNTYHLSQSHASFNTESYQQVATYGDRHRAPVLVPTPVESRDIGINPCNSYFNYLESFESLYITDSHPEEVANLENDEINHSDGGSVFDNPLVITTNTSITTLENEVHDSYWGGTWQETITTNYLDTEAGATYEDSFYLAAFTSISKKLIEGHGDHETPYEQFSNYRDTQEIETTYTNLEYGGGTGCFYFPVLVQEQLQNYYTELSLPYDHLTPYKGSYLHSSTQQEVETTQIRDNYPYADPILVTTNSTEEQQQEDRTYQLPPSFYYPPYSTTETWKQTTKTEFTECEPGMESEIVVGHRIVPSPVLPPELPRLKVRENPSYNKETKDYFIEEGYPGGTYADLFTWVEFNVSTTLDVDPELSPRVNKVIGRENQAAEELDYIFLLESPDYSTSHTEVIVDPGVSNNEYESPFNTPYGYPGNIQNIRTKTHTLASYQLPVADYWTPFEQFKQWWGFYPSSPPTLTAVAEDILIAGTSYEFPTTQTEVTTKVTEFGGLQIVGGFVADYVSSFGDSYPFDSFLFIPTPTSEITYEPIHETVTWCSIPATYTSFEIDQWFEQVIEVSTPPKYKLPPEYQAMGESRSWHLVLETSLGLLIATPTTLYWTSQTSFTSTYEQRSPIFDKQHRSLYLEFVIESEQPWSMGAFTLNLNARGLLSDRFNQELQVPQKNVAGFRFLISVAT